MPDVPTGAAMIAQSGGPSAVINQSLVGVVEGLRGSASITKTLGARHGVRGMLENSIIDLSDVDQATLDRVAATPSAALGSTRDKPDHEYCEKVLEVFKKLDVRYLFYIGGNDSSDTCRIVHELAVEAGYPLHAFHVPKTIDNDLVHNDHTPGYASAARYVAMAFMGDSLDNRALPGIKLDVVMGRHAGFLTGAAGMLREREEDGPHLILMPERAFVFDEVLGEVDRVYTKLGRCHIAVSEGVQDRDGTPVAALLTDVQERDAHGNIRLSGSGALGDTLAQFISRKLTPEGGKAPRTRADTLGYAQRYWPDASPVDQREAREVGRFAASQALSGIESGSITIQRTAGPGSPSPVLDYAVDLHRVELSDVAAKTRHMPDEFISADGRGVTPAFCDWLRPMLGDMPRAGWL